MDLNALFDFALVAANGGLGKASRASGKSKATLSRRISELEEQLGIRLIERGARGLKLTEAGEMLMARTEAPMREVAEAMTATREGLSAPRGCLRIASPVLFSHLAMGRICTDFCEAYPDVTVDLVAADRIVDLVEEQFDVAIRINPSPDSNLVGRCFAKDRLVVVAAPSVPMPSGGAIRSVPGIVFSNFEPTHWRIDEGRLVLQPIPRLKLSSFLMIRDAAVTGAGVALNRVRYRTTAKRTAAIRKAPANVRRPAWKLPVWSFMIPHNTGPPKAPTMPMEPMAATPMAAERPRRLSVGMSQNAACSAV